MNLYDRAIEAAQQESQLREAAQTPVRPTAAEYIAQLRERITPDQARVIGSIASRSLPKILEWFDELDISPEGVDIVPIRARPVSWVEGRRAGYGKDLAATASGQVPEYTEFIWQVEGVGFEGSVVHYPAPEIQRSVMLLGFRGLLPANNLAELGWSLTQLRNREFAGRQWDLPERLGRTVESD